MSTENKKRRILWLIFIVGLAISFIGAVLLLNPTSEFFIVGIFEKLNLPVGQIANFAFFAEIALFAISVLGILTMSIRALISRHR